MASQVFQAGRAAAVTPSNTVDIPSVAGSVNYGNVLFVGTGGNLRVLTIGGDDVTFNNIQDGSFLPLQVTRVYATGTTASQIIALW